LEGVVLADDISDRIAIACPDELDGIVRDAWGDHINGLLTENEIEVLDEAARARREAFPERRTEARPPRGAQPRAAPQTAPPAPARPRRAIPRSPDRAASRQRRRDIGQERWLPPCIANKLTQGEIAVLSVMAREIVHHGVCDLPNDKIAGLAGVCPTLVKNTRRLAEEGQWIKVIPRPRRGEKSLTNLIYALSPELQAWIATRRKMIGGKSLATTKTRYSDASTRNPETVPGYRRKGLGNERRGVAEVAAGPK
jgi:hypothetical protein